MHSAIQQSEAFSSAVGSHLPASKFAVAGSRKESVALSGWGGFPRARCQLLVPSSLSDLRLLFSAHPTLIARGNGRAYGDAALNPSAIVATARFDRILSFNEATGLVVCEAGVLLSDLIAAVLPHGWFPPVVPGTKHVTIGGMIAADVHGKNQPHAGTFARHVEWIELMIGDGTVLRCASSENQEVFEATLGGMGLTGIIIRAAFALMRIESSLMVEKTIRCADLTATFAAFEANCNVPYSVAWLDCLSQPGTVRSIVHLGHHASTELRASEKVRQNNSSIIRIPSGFPGLLANRTIVSAFNRFRFACKRDGTHMIPLDRFFFPLDAVGDWNRLYGRRGLIQYQFALPSETAHFGIEEILRRITKGGHVPLFAVLKRFGPGRGMMSFPMTGYTVALDFAATRETIEFLRRFDCVSDFGGRIYLAKDAISTPTRIDRSYSDIDAFRALRRHIDPRGRFSSLLSQRLGL